MISRAQLQTLQIARRQLERTRPDIIDDAWWRLVLRNVGHVAPDAAGHVSAKALNHAGFESVMAHLEEAGYRDSRGENFWRTRDSSRTGFLTSRQLHEIHQLARRQSYDLATLCHRVSRGAHTQPSKLTPAQARDLIEGLKQIIHRQEVPA